MKNIFTITSALEKRLVIATAIAVLLAPLSLEFKKAEDPGAPAELPSIGVAHASASEISPLAETFLGSDMPLEEARTIVDEQKAFVSSREAYPASLRVITKHERTIIKLARKHGVPEDVALGIGLLENGGSEKAKSTAGAVGIFQLMPGTARNLGLKVGRSTDERLDPEKNINAGMTYLRKNYNRFGDWGLAAWAYHAGEGNVVKALKAYARSTDGARLPGIEDFSAHRRYVEKNGITIHKLLSNPEVQAFTEKLNDDSSGYPYKVAATAKLFEESK